MPVDDLAVHLDQAPVRVVREPRVAGAAANPRTASSFSPRSRIESIIPGIEIAAPERTETSSGFDGSPNVAAGDAFEPLDVLGDLVLEAGGQLAAARQERAAGVSRDREPGRDRHAEVRHLRQPEALAAEQFPPAGGGLVEGVHEARSRPGARGPRSSWRAPLEDGRGAWPD